MNINAILEALQADPKASKTTIVGDRYSITIQMAEAYTAPTLPPKPPPFRNPSAPLIPIPNGVFYNKESDNFYSAVGNKVGMGEHFYYTWKERWKEFPQSAASCT